MKGDGTLELIQAVREVLLDDSDLAAAGIFQQTIPREDELPAVVFTVPPGVGMKHLGPVEVCRTYGVQIKVVAIESAGQEALEVAGPLVTKVYQLFTATISGVTPADRLNAKLNSLGFEAKIPVESGGIGPYKDYVGQNRDVERWHLGNKFNLRIQAL